MKSCASRSLLFGRLAMGAAASIALYLSAMTLSDTVLPGCDAGSVCQESLRSPWAFAFGMPISFPGFVIYSLTLLLSWGYVRRERTVAGLAGGMGIAIILAAAAWVVFLQIFIHSAICVWCVLAHACGLTGALLFWRCRMQNPPQDIDCSNDLRDAGTPLANDRFIRLATWSSAIAALAVLALGASPRFPHQPVPATAAAAAEISPAQPAASVVSLFGGAIGLNSSQFPELGGNAGGAPRGVLLADFSSSRCRQYIPALDTALASGSNPVSVLLLPASESVPAGDLPRVILTLFHADRASWEAVSALLTSGQIPAETDKVEAVIVQRLGREKWDRSVQAHAAAVESQLQLSDAIRKTLRERGKSYPLPLLLCGERTLAGAELDPAKLRAFLQHPDGAEPDQEAGSLTAKAELEGEVTVPNLEPGVPREIEFSVRNAGSASLKLDWVSLDEDCEIIKLPQCEVPPGETVAVGIRVTLPREGGESFVRHLKLHSNAPDSPGSVTVRGNCRPQLATGGIPVTTNPPRHLP